MFLRYCFNLFNFVTATKSSVILLITLFTEFFSCNSDMHKIISPKNVKRLKLGSLRLHRKTLELCFINVSSLSFPSFES